MAEIETQYDQQSDSNTNTRDRTRHSSHAQNHVFELGSYPNRLTAIRASQLVRTTERTGVLLEIREELEAPEANDPMPRANDKDMRYVSHFH